MVRRTKEEALATRRRILNAAIEIFAKRHWKDVTLGEVAQYAGVTRGAVYWHFISKEALFDAVCEASPLPAELVDLGCATPCDADPLGSIRQACRTALRDVAVAGGSADVYAWPANREELVDPGGSLLLRHRASVRQARDSLQQRLEWAVERGQLPRGLDTRLAARLLHGIMAGLVSDWLLAAHDFDLVQEGERSLEAALSIFGALAARSRPG